MKEVTRSCSVFPRWALLAYRYEHGLPNHRGKRTLLHAVYRLATPSGRAFVWRMRNGALLALSPAELAQVGTVGWSCFHNRAWEPHIERALRDLLHPGDTVYDVGANLGYFSAVMAQEVGPSGRVYAFEPLAPTFALLVLCRDLNEFSQLMPLQLALGAKNGSVELTFNPVSLGQASLYAEPDSVDYLPAQVPIRRLDDLVESYELAPPRLVKLDVEGSELAVIEGAERLLAQHSPAVIFELNSVLSRRAGWTGSDIAARLRKAGDYDFFLLTEGAPRPVEPEWLDSTSDGYIDVLALARSAPAGRALSVRSASAARLSRASARWTAVRGDSHRAVE